MTNLYTVTHHAPPTIQEHRNPALVPSAGRSQMLILDPGIPKSIGCHVTVWPTALGRAATTPRPMRQPPFQSLHSCPPSRVEGQAQLLKPSIAAKLPRGSDPGCWVGPPNHTAASSRQPPMRPRLVCLGARHHAPRRQQTRSNRKSVRCTTEIGECKVALN